MAQQTEVSGLHLGALHVSVESAFCTPGTEYRCFPVTGTVDLALGQDEVDATRLSTRPYDYKNPTRTYKTGTCKFEHFLQPCATVLTKAATPDTDEDAPLRMLMRALFGGEHIAAGSEVAAGSHSTTGFSVDAGEGARFPAGKIIAVDGAGGGGGAENLQPCRVTSRATDALTVWPALANAPVENARIINSATWYPTPSNATTLSIALAAARGTGLQWRLLGATGGVTLSFARGEMAKVAFDLVGADHTGPLDLGLSTSVVDDPMADPHTTRGAEMLLQPQGTTTRVCFKVDTLTVTPQLGMAHLPTLTCGHEGMKGVQRTEGLLDAFATIELVCDVDTDADTSWWANRTELSLLFWLPLDTSTSRRMIGFDAPRCVIVGKPVYSNGDHNIGKLTITLKTKLDDSTSGTLDVEALALAPLRVFTL